MIRTNALSMTVLALLAACPLAAQEAAEETPQEAAQQAAPQAMTHDHAHGTAQQVPPQAAEEAVAQAADQESMPASGQQQMTPEMMQMMEAYQKAGAPGAEHQRMAEMAGSYDLTIKSWNGPGTEPTVDTGTATRKTILGDRVLVEDVTSQMMGQPFTGHAMTGYDNVSDRYWSTWVDSMSTGMMASEGTCDASMGCTFTGTYNDAMTGKPKTVRMTSRWTDANTEVFEMHGPGPDGKEMKMMEITYRKRGS